MRTEEWKRATEFVRRIPPDEFDIDHVWLDRGCGSVGCAIGHLQRAGMLPDLYTTGNVCCVAVEYYGVTVSQAMRCFNNGDRTWGLALYHRVTPAMVAGRMVEVLSAYVHPVP